MKIKTLIAFILLPFSIGAQAAIAVVQSSFTPTHFASGTTSGTATGSLTNPVASGNAVLIGFGGNDGYANKTITSITDNKGNTYTTLTYDSTTTFGQGWFLATNVTNGPNTSFSAPFTQTSSQANIVIAVYEISGLTGSPADYANLLSTTFSTTINKAFTTAVTNEEGFAILSNSGNATSWTPSNGWTSDYQNYSSGVTYNAGFAHVALPTSGSNSIQGTGSASDIWQITVVSLKPATGATCTNNFWSSTGAYAIPNGTTGSYWSTTGAFATPDCSTGSYWLKSGAVGAN